ncbi:unnamed protein product [Auanema sp. JU1783]|nr:unnamed protein product [Auanema sp. JU1783]
MTHRWTKRLLQMNDDELDAITAIAIPGRQVHQLLRNEKQEICMKWLFANGLSMSHEFTLAINEDGECFILLSPKKHCQCCTKDDNIASLRSFDKSVIGTTLASTLKDEMQVDDKPPETSNNKSVPPLYERRNQKIQPIHYQPNVADTNKKDEKEEEESCWKIFCREYGMCCVNLWSNV